MTTTLAGKEVNVNAEGYLTDLNQWTKEIALEIAMNEEVNMTEKTWQVIAWLQEQFRNDNPLTMRKVGKSGVTDIKEFYALFPNGPLKKASKIAGIPKPVSCI